MKKVEGNVKGLKAWVVDQLQALYDEKDSNEYICDQHLLDTLCHITQKTNKEILLIFSKTGQIEHVVVGDAYTVSFKENQNSFKLIHTHPSGNFQLSKTDESILMNGSIEMVAALGVQEATLTGIQIGYYDVHHQIQLQSYSDIHQTTQLVNELYQNKKNQKESKLIEVDSPKERTLTVGLTNDLDELNELVYSADGIVVSSLVQNRDLPDRETYIGKGKIAELKQLIQIHNIQTVVLDDEISIGQQRKMEDELQVKVIDRTLLILDIFAKRAHTKEGKLQVELAQLNYLLPRLTGKGKILSRLGGGIGTRGPGETQLETDRRHIGQRIQQIKKQLENVKKRRSHLREKRKQNQLYTFSVVGYTNSGKTTLINALTKSDLYAEDLLFATLDPSARGCVLDSGTSCLFIDTVGFVNKLPHDLVEAFASTLEEITWSDCILHVIDGANPEMEQQKQTVYNILKQIGANHIPVIEIVNKADKVNECKLKKHSDGQSVLVSAKTGFGLDQLMKQLDQQINGDLVTLEIDVPYENGVLISYIHENAQIVHKSYQEKTISFLIKANKKSAIKIQKSL